MKKRIIAVFTILFAFTSILSVFPKSDISAASLKIRYGGKTRYYTGKQLNFTYAKKGISTKTPGIQMKSINMIPYYSILVKNGPKIKRSYSKKTGKLVLKYKNKTLTFYKNKKTCYVNGKKKTLSAAPVSVKYYTIKKYNILLPANFTIKNLGLDYSYISSAKRIHINKPGNSYLYTKNTTTNYNKKTSDYIKSQTVKSYGGKKINYNNYVPTSTDPTHGYQYLRLNTYRTVNSSKYNSLLNSKVKSKSVLKNKGSVLNSAAKTYKIDPVYFLCQTILETGYGTSTLSQGKSITKVITGKSVVKDKKGNVTGFQKVNGKYQTKKISSKKYTIYTASRPMILTHSCADSATHTIRAGQVWTKPSKALQNMSVRNILITVPTNKIPCTNSATIQIPNTSGTSMPQIRDMPRKSENLCTASSEVLMRQAIH